ncbi:hypothetical protein CSB20_14880 [bacterium DOLZORAL124_64_63]|nr:MAG: hypothetical protein CSB20_14880 [bacterium DOLZORAL124_64_63]
MAVVPTGDGDDDDGVVWYRCPQCQGFLPKLKGAQPEASEPDTAMSEATTPEPAASAETVVSAEASEDIPADDLPWDSPAAMMRAMERAREGTPPDAEDAADDDDVLVGTREAEPLPRQVAETSQSWSIPPEDLELPDGIAESGTQDIAEGINTDTDTDTDTRTGTTDADTDPADTEPEPDTEPILEYAAMLAASDVSRAVPYRPWGNYEVGQCVTHLAWDDCGVVVAKEELPGGRKAIKCYFEDAGVIRLIEQAPQ